jgi:hypothetical protein
VVGPAWVRCCYPVPIFRRERHRQRVVAGSLIQRVGLQRPTAVAPPRFPSRQRELATSEGDGLHFAVRRLPCRQIRVGDLLLLPVVLAALVQQLTHVLFQSPLEVAGHPPRLLLEVQREAELVVGQRALGGHYDQVVAAEEEEPGEVSSVESHAALDDRVAHDQADMLLIIPEDRQGFALLPHGNFRPVGLPDHMHPALRRRRRRAPHVGPLLGVAVAPLGRAFRRQHDIALRQLH